MENVTSTAINISQTSIFEEEAKGAKWKSNPYLQNVMTSPRGADVNRKRSQPATAPEGTLMGCLSPPLMGAKQPINALEQILCKERFPISRTALGVKLVLARGQSVQSSQSRLIAVRARPHQAGLPR